MAQLDLLVFKALPVTLERLVLLLILAPLVTLALKVLQVTLDLLELLR
jgi:hypothetical protein